MKITLAGYNLDVSLIEEAMNQAEHPEAFTPETIAVAYARISRDPSPVSELREKAISDIEKARKSARAIVFDMGHQSVAEHAAFNFDVLDISRLCVESLEWHRLCSYTEKSQRYQELEEDFVEPSELEGEDLDLFRNSSRSIARCTASCWSTSGAGIPSSSRRSAARMWWKDTPRRTPGTSPDWQRRPNSDSPPADAISNT